MPTQTTYRANGKLLLTAEYLVLYGAKAIALPLNVGQQMVVSQEENLLAVQWQARFQNKIWFECVLNLDDLSVLQTSDLVKSEVLIKLFKAIKDLSSEFKLPTGAKFETTLESNPDWGFGSSSTLVNLLSQWSGVDPFVLNEMVFQGSGFDVACATADGPIFYTRNQPSEPILLDYPFADHLFFVYSGKKKGTANEVRSFLKNNSVSMQQIDEMTTLSEEFAMSSSQDDFNRLIGIHEEMIGKLIEQPPVKKNFFPDFDGAIKSLGAWGGDFMLASSPTLTFEQLCQYFGNKGLTTVFKWDEIILKR